MLELFEAEWILIASLLSAVKKKVFVVIPVIYFFYRYH